MTCPGRDAVLYVLWGHSSSTCRGWKAVISTFPDRNAVLGHALFGTQFNNMPWLEHRFTTCPARDAVSDMSWSERSFLCPVGRVGLARGGGGEFPPRPLA